MSQFTFVDINNFSSNDSYHFAQTRKGFENDFNKLRDGLSQLPNDMTKLVTNIYKCDNGDVEFVSIAAYAVASAFFRVNSYTKGAVMAAMIDKLKVKNDSADIPASVAKEFEQKLVANICRCFCNFIVARPSGYEYDQEAFVGQTSVFLSTFAKDNAVRVIATRPSIGAYINDLPTGSKKANIAISILTLSEMLNTNGVRQAIEKFPHVAVLINAISSANGLIDLGNKLAAGYSKAPVNIVQAESIENNLIKKAKQAKPAPAPVAAPVAAPAVPIAQIGNVKQRANDLLSVQEQFYKTEFERMKNLVTDLLREREALQADIICRDKELAILKAKDIENQKIIVDSIAARHTAMENAEKFIAASAKCADILSAFK